MIKKKHDILTSDKVVGIPSNPLNFTYILFTGKHVPDIVLPNLLNFGESVLSTGDKIPKVTCVWGF